MRPMVRKQRERIRKQLSMTWPTVQHEPPVSHMRRVQPGHTGRWGARTLCRRLPVGEAQALVELVDLFDGFVIERYHLLAPDVSRAVGL